MVINRSINRTSKVLSKALWGIGLLGFCFCLAIPGYGADVGGKIGKKDVKDLKDVEELLEVFLDQEKSKYIKASNLQIQLEPSWSQPGGWFRVESNPEPSRATTYLLLVSTPYGGATIGYQQNIAGIVMQINRQIYVCPPEPFPFEIRSGSLYLVPVNSATHQSGWPVQPPLSGEMVEQFAQKLAQFLSKYGYALSLEVVPFADPYPCGGL